MRFQKHVHPAERECIKAFRNRIANVRAESPFRPLADEGKGDIGIALSGGGVRAATFHLGVLQGLAKHQILPWIDYISSVSGGSFIASWFAKWLDSPLESSTDSCASNAESAPKYREVIAGLNSTTISPEPEPIRRLRRNTAYLTPHLGPFGQDSILFIATYTHQLFIYSLVMLLGATATLLMPYLVLLGANTLLSADSAYSYTLGLGSGFAVWGLLLMIIFFFRSRRSSDAFEPGQRRTRRICLSIAGTAVFGGFWWFLVKSNICPLAVEPLLIGIVAALTTTRVWNFYRTLPETRQKFCAWLGLIAAVFSTFSLYSLSNAFTPVHSLSLYVHLKADWDKLAPDSRGLWLTEYGVLSGLSLALLNQNILTVCGKLPERWLEQLNEIGKYLLAAVLLVTFEWYASYRLPDILCHLRALSGKHSPATLMPSVLTIVLAIFIFSGSLTFQCAVAILSRVVSPHVRESTTRTITYLYRYAGLWLLVAGLSFYGPVVTALAISRWRSSIAVLILLTLFFAVVNIVANRGRLRRVIAVAINHAIGYIVLISFASGVAWLIATQLLDIKFEDANLATGLVGFWGELDKRLDGSLIKLMAIISSLLFFLSAKFGVNSSSMHLFYQARLCRAYLDELLPGAERLSTNAGRTNTRISSLVCTDDSSYVGPYLLINSALNLVGGSNTAWQERLSTNFVFSPRFFGYEIPTHCIGRDSGGFAESDSLKYGGEDGVRLGHAMSISGSAVGSNMGSYTSPRGRFLNTLLNFRLGWWFPNPTVSESVSGRIPRSRINLLWRELMGKTNDSGPFVYLSDGGHFENIGLYELVRRECRLVIVSDGSEDVKNRYGSLGNAVERCRVDMGVEIEFANLQAESSGEISQPPLFIVGRIQYKSGAEGVLLCLKTHKTSGMPLDVLSFSQSTHGFPHHPTADQWFSESQFESYRVLGLMLADRLGEALREAEDGGLMSRAFTLLKDAGSRSASIQTAA